MCVNGFLLRGNIFIRQQRALLSICKTRTNKQENVLETRDKKIKYKMKGKNEIT